MRATMTSLLVCCSCLVVTMSTVASSKEQCDTIPQYDTVARASALYQTTIDYFLTRAFCGSPRDGTIWCYFAPPSSIPIEDMCRVADSLRLELLKDWESTRRLLTGPASKMPGFTWPTYDDAPLERAICDKAYFHYYDKDRKIVFVVGTLGIVKLVVEWLDTE
jgi:hypothetical protein